VGNYRLFVFICWLVEIFRLYGLMLTQEDKEAIDKRNHYLHVRSLLTGEQAFGLNQISLRLHALIISLLLKPVGYTGM
jgi:hypothetical protein